MNGREERDRQTRREKERERERRQHKRRVIEGNVENARLSFLSLLIHLFSCNVFLKRIVHLTSLLHQNPAHIQSFRHSFDDNKR